MKIKHLLLVAFVTILASCESDNSSDIAISEADLLGTWNIKEQTLDGSIVFVENGQTSTATYEAFAKDIDMKMTFGNNPKKVSAEGKYTLVATVNLLGQSQTDEELVEAINDPLENPNWELNGNNITLSNDNTLPGNLIIESYNGTTLRLKADINEIEADSGQSITIKTTVYFVLEK